MHVTIFGLGYIGLPTSAIIAAAGHSVLGVDVSLNIVKSVNEGKTHIVEPDLEELVQQQVSAGSLVASAEPVSSDVYIICVPTPISFVNGKPQPDLSFVFKAVEKISEVIKDGDLVILESTSPIGTTEKIEEILKQKSINTQNIHLAYCPERVLPGNILEELILNDRIVGGLSEEANKVCSSFYETFVRGTIHTTNAKTAEMCKLTENSFRDANIAFANEISIICDESNIDSNELIKLANRHPRVNILEPGVGVGGHCIAVDPWFLVATNYENARLIRTVREINLYKTQWVISKIKEEYKKTGLTQPIVCLGLSFKPNIDDLRESPALNIVNQLVVEGYDVVTVEPNINEHPSLKLFTLREASKMSEFFVLLVAHDEFKEPDFKEFINSKKTLDFVGVL